MITTKSLRYFILAGLIVALPTHPMGWLNTTWKKVGVGVAAVAAVTALIAVVYGIKQYTRKHDGTRTFALEYLDILHAISDNNPERLEHLILITRPNSLVSLTFTSLIFYAAQCNSDKAIAILLKHGVHVNAETMQMVEKENRTDTVLMTPLAIATHYKSCDAIKILLEHGAVLNPDRGRNVYYYAKDPQVIQLLDNHRREMYKKNKQSISQEIFDVTTSFSADLTEIMAGYAAQDPFHHTYAKEENSLEYEKELLNEFPLFPKKPSQLHEQQVKEFVAAAPQRNPLSLDENA